jgi:osmotically-inducible protein OsmY
MNELKQTARTQRRVFASILCTAVAVASLAGCAPLVVGGAVAGGTMVVLDRRSSGTQIDDESIELRASNRVREAIGDRGHINVTSYNRQVLITGEVQNEADKTAVEQAVARIESVRTVVNELAIMGPSSLTARSNDAILTGKVKATFVDAGDLHAQVVKVVTERGIVYLMGRVTEREAERATDLARRVSGVQKVVRAFEIVTEAELADMKPKAIK